MMFSALAGFGKSLKLATTVICSFNGTGAPSPVP
jgi:hypothetical protein